ncbi:MAG: DUF3108 domain-containing protein [Bacteroidales bacterium]|nr:DUF3108 domain-containing protein [Bacteroidales bacterium]
MKKIIILYFFLLFTNIVNSQCFTANTTFLSGEKISYIVAYNWGFIWVDAGKVTFEVDSLEKNGKNVYHFLSSGKSLTRYDWIFKVRDYFESFAETIDLKPLEFFRNTNENGYRVYNKYVFDHSLNKIFSFTENSNKDFLQDTLDLPACTFDVLTAIYYTRNIDFSKYKFGDKIPVSMIIDNEIFNLFIRYINKEVVENIDGKLYNCIKFKAMLVEGTIFSKGEDLTVWVTDDKNKIPIIAEAKILVGSVKAYLTQAKGLKYKIEALIE